MHVEDLRWFVVLAESENLTAAAGTLGTSQPTLSRALRRVEDAFGVQLFEREHRGLKLNPYGRIALEAARAGTATLDAASQRIDALRDPDSGTVRLAFLYSVATGVVPDLLKAFRSVAPSVRFALREEPSHEIVRDLESGEADLGITGPRPATDLFSWHLLERQRLCLYVPPGHRLVGPGPRRSDRGRQRTVHRAPSGLRVPSGHRRTLPGRRVHPAALLREHRPHDDRQIGRRGARRRSTACGCGTRYGEQGDAGAAGRSTGAS